MRYNAPRIRARSPGRAAAVLALILALPVLLALADRMERYYSGNGTYNGADRDSLQDEFHALQATPDPQ